MTLLLICAAIALIAITILTEKGEGWWSFWTLLGFSAVVYLFQRDTFHNVLDYIKDNVGFIIACAIVYVGIGIVWALAKWRWFCIKKYEYLQRYSGYETSNVIEARDYASMITAWMAWWPTSMLWWILNDPITRFYKYLHKKLSKVFDSISRSAKASVTKSE